jgi:pyruvate-ferredoxin/flavodoxin oxidoreductase
MNAKTAAIDGNTAVVHVGYRVNEVCAIYPITPSSPMAELADEWSALGVKNIWGNVPVVQEMQSEGGAAGAVHGALQAGALTATFTSSQGLMLMLPNMYKIAGELTPTVFHVAARSLATQALSIFGDHSDVMATRASGFALLCSGSVQEAHDNALIAQAAALASRVPFLHFFGGFRTSHEINTVEILDEYQIRAMIDDNLVRGHRARALDPAHPVVRGTAHNADTFFQARETVNPFYAAVPAIVQSEMDRFAALTNRQYHLFDYDGPPDADRIVVAMGTGAEITRETAAWLRKSGEKLGVVQVRLFRPFSSQAFLSTLPPTCQAIAVIEQTKEPGAPGEPLYLDVLASLANGVAAGKRPCMPRVIGGRYGLSSKDFTPAMAKSVFEALARAETENGFTVGIDDDVSHRVSYTTRPFPSKRLTPFAQCSMASVRTGRSESIRTASRSSRRMPGSMLSAISCTIRINQERRRLLICGSGHIQSVLLTSFSRRILLPAINSILLNARMCCVPPCPARFSW